MIELKFEDGREYKLYPHAYFPDDRCLLDINRYFLSKEGKLYFKGYTDHYYLSNFGFESVSTELIFYIRTIYETSSKCKSLTIKSD